MPSPLLQLRIPQDLADWLEAKYPSRGEIAEYVRQLLTAEQMKEAVAPLVPAHWSKGSLTDEEWKELNRQQAADGLPAGLLSEEGNRLPNEFDAYKAEPKPKARRKKSVKDSLTTSGEASTSRKAPRSRQRANTPASVARSKSESPSLPVRCHCKRGMIIGAGARKGQCTVCGNPKPLKEPT